LYKEHPPRAREIVRDLLLKQSEPTSLVTALV